MLRRHLAGLLAIMVTPKQQNILNLPMLDDEIDN